MSVLAPARQEFAYYYYIYISRGATPSCARIGKAWPRYTRHSPPFADITHAREYDLPSRERYPVSAGQVNYGALRFVLSYFMMSNTVYFTRGYDKHIYLSAYISYQRGRILGTIKQ